MIKLNRRKLCECGCGQVVKNRFVHNHHRPRLGKGKPKSPPQVCACGICGRITNPGNKYIKGHSYKGKPAANKGMSPSAETVAKRKKSRKGYKHSDETKKKIGEGNKGKIRSIETLQKYSESHIGKRPSEEEKRKNKEALLKYWSIPENRNAHIESIRIACKDAGRNKKIGEATKKFWQNQEWAARQAKAMNKGLCIRPNKPEMAILNILEELFPNQWKYTGDFSLVIDGKSPDFANVNGQKKLIEMFGDYWHKGEDPEDRAKIFKPFGYKTLVVWQHELEDINLLKDKMKEFHNK